MSRAAAKGAHGKRENGKREGNGEFEQGYQEFESLPLRYLHDSGFSGRLITGGDPFQGFNVNE